MVSSSPIRTQGDKIIFSKSKKGKLLKALTETLEFRRLRDIQQLGFSDHSFPDAKHTRYAHSLGVYARACDFCDRVKKKFPKFYDPDKAFELKLKALLHDIGHGPFSHSFEIAAHALGSADSHEAWTSRIILSDDTEIGKLLSQYDADNETNIRENVGQFFATGQIQDFWDSAISSQLDVDRLDYLRRDAQEAGLPVGVDSEYILSKFEIATYEGQAVIAYPVRAIPNLELYLQSRSMLYNKLYHDPDCQACDLLFAEVCKSVREALGDKSPEVLGLSRNNAMVRYLASVSTVPVDAYLALTDSQVNTFLDELQQAEEPALASAKKRVQRMRSKTPLHIVNYAEYKPNFSRKDFDEAETEFQKIAAKVNGGAIAIGDFYTKAAYNPKKPSLEQILIRTESGIMQISDLGNGLPSDIRHGYFMSERPEVVKRFKKALPALVV